MKARSLTVRLATHDDAAAIAAMSRAEIEQGLGWSWTEARVARAIEAGDKNVIVVGAPGALVGFGIMAYADENAHLMLFAVTAAQRRHGVGSAMLGWLETVARDGGVQRIALECRRNNDAARNFYGEHGYQEVRIARRYYQGIEDAVVLEKYLRPVD